MGLDQTLYAKINGENEKIQYFRKHPDLHGAIAAMWAEETGGDPDTFNCIPYQLDRDQLEQLKAMTEADELPHTEGFFFGQSYPEDKPVTLEALDKALELEAEGHEIYYDSWW